MEVWRVDSFVDALRWYASKTTVKLQHLTSRQLIAEADPLRQKTHQSFCRASLGPDVKTVYRDLSCGWQRQPDQTLQRGRLAASVWSEQRKSFAAFNVKRHVVNRDEVFKPLSQFADLNSHLLLRLCPLQITIPLALRMKSEPIINPASSRLSDVTRCGFCTLTGFINGASSTSEDPLRIGNVFSATANARAAGLSR